MAESVKNKAVKGVIWSAVDQFANQGIAFVVGLVLARILTPNEYGLIGIITIFIVVSNVFINSGFASALIRKPDASDQDYNTVFIYNLVVSGLLMVVMWFGAPFIAEFFRREELVDLTRVMSLLLLINAMTLVQSTMLTKQINFKKQTKISLIASISSGVIGIAMALLDFGVWALVGQQLSRQGLNSLFLWVWSSWRPKFKFYVDSFKTMWAFGWKMLVSSIIDTTWKEIYQVVIGRFYSPASLGQYTRAQQFSQIFSTNITNVVQRVSYPVLSSIQDDRERLKQGYRKVIRVTMFVSFTCMLILAAISKPMIITLIGEKWIPASVFLQIICFQGMLYPLHAINLNMLQVQGRSDLFLKLEIIKKTIAVGPLMLGIFVSIDAMLIGSVVTSCIAYYLNAYYSGPFLNYSMKAQIKDIFPSFSLALGVALPTYLISYVPFIPQVVLLMQLSFAAVTLIILCEWVKVPEYVELKGIVTNMLKRKKAAKSTADTVDSSTPNS